MRARPTLGRMMTLLLAGVFALLTAELLFRHHIFPDYKDLNQALYAPHPLFGHYNRPHAAARRFNPGNYDVVNHTSADGFRGNDAMAERGLSGIWVAGDSNTFGGFVGDDETFVAHLDASGQPAVNLASEGHGMGQQARVIRWLAQRGHRPQAVVLAISMYHAIGDQSVYRQELTRPFTEPVAENSPTPEGLGAAAGLIGNVERLWLETVPHSLMAVRAKLIKGSALYGWLKVGITGVPALRDLASRMGLRADVDTVMTSPIAILQPLEPGNPATAWIASSADFLADLSAVVARETGAHLGVVLLPHAHQLYPMRFDKFLRATGRSDQDLDAARPLHALEKALRERGVKVLAPLEALRQGASGQPLTFPDDGHLNGLGHEILAREIAVFAAKDLAR